MDSTFNLTYLTSLPPTIYSEENLARLSLDQLDALLQPQQIFQLMQPGWLTSPTSKVTRSLSKKKIKLTPAKHAKSRRVKRPAPVEVFQHRVSPSSSEEIELSQPSKKVKHGPFIPLDGPLVEGPLKSFPSQLTDPTADLRLMPNFDGTPMTPKSQVFLTRPLPSPPPPLVHQSLSALSYILFNLEMMTPEIVEACVVNLIQKNDTNEFKQAILQKAIELSFYFTNHFHPKEKSDRTAALSLTLIKILIEKGVTPHLLSKKSKQNLLQFICLQNFPSSNTHLKPELINMLLPHYAKGDFSDALNCLVYKDIFQSKGSKEEGEQRLLERLKLSPDKNLQSRLLRELIKYDYLGVIAAFSTQSNSFINHFLTQLYLTSTFNLNWIQSKFKQIVPSFDPLTQDLVKMVMEISCHNPKELPIDDLMKFFRSSLQVHAFDLNPKDSPPDRTTYKDENILELLLHQFSVKGTKSHYKLTLALLDFILEKIYSHLLDSHQLMAAGGNLQVFTPQVVIELERIIQALKDEHSLLNPSSTSLVDSSSVRSVSTISEQVDLNQKALRALICLLTLAKKSQYIKKEEDQGMDLEEEVGLHLIKVLDSSPINLSIPTKCWGVSACLSLLSVMKDLIHFQVTLVGKGGFEKMQPTITKIDKIFHSIAMTYRLIAKIQEDPSNLTSGVSAVIECLKQELGKPTYYEMVLPGGYVTPERGGHFVLYSLQKQPHNTTYSFTIINGGEGYAPPILLPLSGKQKVHDYYYAGLTLKELSSEFFHTLFNFWIPSASKNVNQETVLNFIDQFFKKTQPRIRRRVTKNHPHAPQQKGSCSIKSITPFLKRTLAKYYRSYKYVATRHSNARFIKKIRKAPMQDLIHLFGLSPSETSELIQQIKNANLAKEKQRFRKCKLRS